ncbi:hypothetical protein D3C87_1166060 [compost metagenome]
MSDEDDGHALGLDPVDQRQNGLHLCYGKRRSGFVHDQDLGIEGRRTGDCDCLPLSAGEFFHLGRQPWNTDFQRVEHLAGLGQHRLPVEERTLGDLAPKKQVADHVYMVTEAQILKDHLDIAIARIGGTGETDLFPFERNGSFIRNVGSGNNLRQRRFSSRVVTDKAQAFTGIDVEIDAAQRLM